MDCRCALSPEDGLLLGSREYVSLPESSRRLPQVFGLERTRLPKLVHVVKGLLNHLPGKHFGNAGHGDHHVLAHGRASDTLKTKMHNSINFQRKFT